ncbi:MAG: putative CDP-diacylglycerol--glycerol-3-phosphate 3-phosphatidyl-transferase 2 [Verrucomicrobiota bacterium]|jgi:CDP-diacylglycerol--glycerol-3-phosphate 3-phosphatidyltransferase
MTLANKITLTRIGLIPVFVLFAVYYGMSFTRGQPEEWLRWGAVSAFGIAAISDGLDGFIARRYNQRTQLGVLLDPIADKGLLLAGIITLSFSGWAYELPVWFAVLVVARDLIVVVGAGILVVLQGKAAVRTTWTGKAATALQMAAIVGVMLQSDFLRHPIPSLGGERLVWLDLPVLCAALFTTLSGVMYSVRGIAQMHLGGHGDPVPWPEKEGKKGGDASGVGAEALGASLRK